MVDLVAFQYLVKVANAGIKFMYKLLLMKFCDCYQRFIMLSVNHIMKDKN